MIFENKPQKNIAVIVLGIIIVLLGIFIIRIPFLESISAISPDHNITSIDLIVSIYIIRVIFIAAGLLLVLYPFISPRIKKFSLHIILYINKNSNVKIKLTHIRFVIFLLILLFSYFGIIFFSHFHQISAQRQIQDQSRSGLTSDAVKTFQYFNKLITTPFITDPDPANLDIPIYRIYIEDDFLDELNSDLPASGFKFIDGSITIGNTTYDSKLRYRGDTFYHWYFKKKSWRVKLKDKQLINRSNTFNLVNPKLDPHIQEILAYYIAEKADLIVPRNFPAAIYLNDEYMGVYFYSDQIDESFIRMRNLVPGDIYYGEIYGVEDKTGTLFDTAENWDIMATSDNNETRAFQNMAFFINMINKSEKEFYKLFNRHMGDEYLKFYAVNLLLDEFRVDNYHNHKLYFDPTSGKFRPIVWDIMPFMNRSLDLNNDDSNVIFSKINLIPSLVEKRNAILNELMEEVQEEDVLEYIDNVSGMIDYEMDHDKFKDAYDAPWILTDDDWQASLNELKTEVHNRYSFLKERLDNVTVVLSILDNNLIFDISGESGIVIEKIELEKDVGSLCYSLYRDMNLDSTAQQSEKIAESCSSSLDFKSEKLYPGNNHTLRYKYILKTTDHRNYQISRVSAYNSVTGTRINPSINILDSEDQLPEITSQSSIHPWLLYEDYEDAPKQIILEGEISLNEDIVLESGDLLIIKPGTTIRLAPGVSIISYGKVTAEGTPEMPIRFVPLEKDKPWGAVALQGEGADRSSFSYCYLKKGSGAKHDLVHYTGMLSAYNSDITINHCSFDSNQIEDDAFNSKYADITIKNSEFTNTYGDAIDFDISTGRIENTNFYNINGDAIDLMTSSPLIEGNFIRGVLDKGISVGEMSHPYIYNNIITEAQIGIAIKDLSNPLIINNTIKTTSIGIAAYEKNWRYGGGGRGTIIESDICHNKRPILLQNLSVVNISHGGSNLQCTAEDCNLDCDTENIN